MLILAGCSSTPPAAPEPGAAPTPMEGLYGHWSDRILTDPAPPPRPAAAGALSAELVRQLSLDELADAAQQDPPPPPVREPERRQPWPPRPAAEDSALVERQAQPRPADPPGISVEEVEDFDLHRPYLRGMASWYGPGFHGKRTANGEVYNQYALTAAHPTLPLGTVIEVTNRENGRRLWVRVNDRGPYKKGRILDLSRVAAQQLGMIEKGTARVSIRVVRWPPRVMADPALRPYVQYVVQVAAYDEPGKAERLRTEMAHRYRDLSFWLDPRPNGYLGIVAGPYDRREEAVSVGRRLQRAGIVNMVRNLRK